MTLATVCQLVELSQQRHPRELPRRGVEVVQIQSNKKLWRVQYVLLLSAYASWLLTQLAQPLVSLVSR